MREWDPEKKRYTGEELNVLVDYIVRGENTDFGLDCDYCVMSLGVRDDVL